MLPWWGLNLILGRSSRARSGTNGHNTSTGKRGHESWISAVDWPPKLLSLQSTDFLWARKQQQQQQPAPAETSPRPVSDLWAPYFVVPPLAALRK